MKKLQSKNQVILMGRLGNNPEIKTRCLVFNLATTESFKKQNVSIIESSKKDFQPYENKTTWHNIVIFGDYLIEQAKTLNKGDKIEVQGKISYSDYTNKDGMIVKTISILVDQFNGKLFLIEESKEKEMIKSNSLSEDWDNFGLNSDDELMF